ncbi:MAG: hypothetical protein MUF19_02705 [Candidatus Pacebacteria bacterium]|jgi:hypothetical protein|nr:hypothetical protein [Candidatus Paceibacterota bacterium]
MKRVPSDGELASYANQLYMLFGLDDDLATPNIIEAAYYVRDVPSTELNPFILWSLLHPETGGYVRMREYDDNGRLPKPHHLKRLFGEFLIACREALTLPVDGETGIRLWQVGAFGRAIRPFHDSNTITFLLIENRLRLDCGLRWNHRCFSKETFEQYYAKVFRTNFAWAFEP